MLKLHGALLQVRKLRLHTFCTLQLAPVERYTGCKTSYFLVLLYASCKIFTSPHRLCKRGPDDSRARIGPVTNAALIGPAICKAAPP